MLPPITPRSSFLPRNSSLFSEPIPRWMHIGACTNFQWLVPPVSSLPAGRYVFEEPPRLRLDRSRIGVCIKKLTHGPGNHLGVYTLRFETAPLRVRRRETTPTASPDERPPWVCFCGAIHQRMAPKAARPSQSPRGRWGSFGATRSRTTPPGPVIRCVTLMRARARTH